MSLRNTIEYVLLSLCILVALFPFKGVADEERIYVENDSDLYLSGYPVMYRYATGEVSAYSSTLEQTDSTPFITASNQYVRDGIVANNCLDFGTLVEINKKVYEVQDRMNSRYGCDNFDIWMSNTLDARQFGRRQLDVIIYAY